MSIICKRGYQIFWFYRVKAQEYGPINVSILADNGHKITLKLTHKMFIIMMVKKTEFCDQFAKTSYKSKLLTLEQL